MCFLQRHLKRLLAYSTIAHAGVSLVGIGLLRPKALAGAANMVFAHAFLKGGLFLCAGILLQRLAAVDELRLHGRGRALPVVGALYGAAAVGLVGLPYVGDYLGHSLIGEAATTDGKRWLPPLLAITTAVAAGAMLRAGARIFLGWGSRDDDLLTPEPPEEAETQDAWLPLMVAVTAILVTIGLAASVIPGFGARTEAGAEQFRDRVAYTDHVLKGQPVEPPPPLGYSLTHTTSASLGYGGLAAVVAALTFLLGLYRQRLPSAVRAIAARSVGPPVQGLRALHTGVIGDYVMWLVVGTSVIGGVWALTLR